MSRRVIRIDRPWALGPIALAALLALGGSPPEVVRVRAPSDRVASFFPPGADLRVLEPARFDELFRAARDRPQPGPGPRILKASHSARWHGGGLVGRSELTVDHAGGRDGLLVLTPWSAAIEGEGAGIARATADGRLGLRVGPDPEATIAIGWRLAARAGSEGRSIPLSLPDCDVAALTLDLPADLVPEAESGAIASPIVPASPGRRSWRFEGAGGPFGLRLRRVGEPADFGPWVRGTTRIDLDQSPANWSASWSIEASASLPSSLTVELDPGLEFLDASGPRVASSRVEPESSPTRVMIRLAGGGTGPTPITIRALCRPPIEGSWAIPSARPLASIWTPGRTVVRPGQARVLQGCSERSGRRVAPEPDEAAAGPALVFEPGSGAGPTAELTFRAPMADASAEVRGWLDLSGDAPRLVAMPTWVVGRGRLLAHAVDLPPGWSPDQVALPGGEPVAWQSESLSSGGTRIHMSPPSPDEGAGSLTLVVEASMPGGGRTGPIGLPRVRPTAPGVRVVDEVWSATPGPGLALRPTIARGLAWVDPPSSGSPPAPWASADPRGGLAWRWVVDDAEARVDREAIRPDPRCDLRLVATIARGRLRLDWTLSIDSGAESIRSIPIRVDGPLPSAPRWRSIDPGGPTVEAIELPEGRRADLGLSEGGRAWELELSKPSRGRFELRGRSDLPWSGSGPIPMLTLPARYAAGGLAVVRVEDSVKPKVVAVGLDPIEATDPIEDDSTSDPDEPGLGPGEVRRAAMFRCPPSGGRLTVETPEAGTSPRGGLIREAMLNTQFAPGSGLLRHRLTLQVEAWEDFPLDLNWPIGAEIERVRLDGQALAPTPIDGGFRVSIFRTAEGRPASSVTIDYRTVDPGSGRLRLSSLIPTIGLPCVSFAWELDAPESWVLAGTTGNLVATDPQTESGWSDLILGFRSRSPARSAPGSDPAAVLADLDAALAHASPEGLDLGGWLVKLDAGRRPILVDRLALRAHGWGPRSRMGGVRPELARSGSVAAILQALGLEAVPIGGSALITTRADAPVRDQAALLSPIRTAAEDGLDRTDRFQSVARWRGEVTPRATSVGEGDDLGLARGLKAHRVAAPGWPSARAEARLVDLDAASRRGWGVALALIAVGYLGRNAGAKARSAGVAAVSVVAAAGIGWAWPEPWAEANGLVRAALVVSAYWLGRSRRSAHPQARRDWTGSAPGRGGRLLSRAAPLAIAATAWADGEGVIPPPILAVLPYVGAPSPDAPVDRVVLSLSDYDRLLALGRKPDPAPSPHPATLASARHLVARVEPGLATVESRYDVEVVGDEPASWTIPVGKARDLSATLDEARAPMVISPEGSSATVAVGGPGRHRLMVRRSVPLTRGAEEVDRLRLPINPAAFARAAVALDGLPGRVEVPGVAGEVEVIGAARDGLLGPVDWLEVVWDSADPSEAGRIRGPVEATMLWEARPIGDLLRARLVHSEPSGISTLRLALEPGTEVLGFAIPGVVGVWRGGTADRPEWTAQVDPPLPAGVPIEISLWRPAKPSRAERRWPGFEVVGAGQFRGMLGFRRPGDWSGRLGPSDGVVSMAEADFARAWGAFPDDRLTLAGAVRFDARPGPIGLETGPVPRSRSVRTSERVELNPGRLDVAVDAVVVDRRGRSFDLELAIPTDFRVVQVEAVGLVDWSRVARDRLRLQFNGSEAPERRVRVRGIVPADCESMLAESRLSRAKIPWPRWLDADTEPGSLVVESAQRFQWEGPDGANPAVAIVQGVHRSTFTVTDPEAIAPVRWWSPSAWVGVSIRSDLMIAPASVQWTATVDGTISGGPAEALHWKLPTDWARGASLQVEGASHRLETEVKGETTTWHIRTDPMAWGRVRLVLSSRRPLAPGSTFPFPNLMPQATSGRGAVDSYELAIANVSGRSAEVDGSTGIQPIAPTIYASTASPAPSGSIDRAYRVTGADWGLGVRLGRAGAGDDVGRARVAEAALHRTIAPDGSGWGRALYELGPGPGPFLPIRFDGPIDSPWAWVEGSSVALVREGPDRWLVPLGDRRARRVELVWHARPTDRRLMALPGLEQAGVPTSLRLTAAASMAVEDGADGLARVDRATWLVESASRLAARSVVRISEFDRDSPGDREAIVDDLAEFELLARDVGRSAKAGPSIDRVGLARSSIDEVARDLGLDDLIEEARVRVGLSAPGPDSDPTPDRRPAPADRHRLRRVGESAHFLGVSRGEGRPPVLGWSLRPTDAGRRLFEAGTVASAGLVLALALAWVALRPPWPIRRSTGAVGVAASIAMMTLEPMGVMALIAAFATGWVSSKS